MKLCDWAHMDRSGNPTTTPTHKRPTLTERPFSGGGVTPLVRRMGKHRYDGRTSGTAFDIGLARNFPVQLIDITRLLSERQTGAIEKPLRLIRKVYNWILTACLGSKDHLNSSNF